MTRYFPTVCKKWGTCSTCPSPNCAHDHSPILEMGAISVEHENSITK